MRIESLYRSAVKPDPIWPECALYCGYTHIEISESMWISRNKEYLIRQYFEEGSAELKEKILSSGSIYHPSSYERSNYSKIVRSIIKSNVISIIGFSPALERLLHTQFYTTIYTDSKYDLTCTEYISSEDLAKATSHMLTLIHEDCTNLKPYISNWGNVLVYSNSMFIEDNNFLEGGNYVTTK